jgi:hypothetical protein
MNSAGAVAPAGAIERTPLGANNVVPANNPAMRQENGGRELIAGIDFTIPLAQFGGFADKTARRFYMRHFHGDFRGMMT